MSETAAPEGAGATESADATGSEGQSETPDTGDSTDWKALAEQARAEAEKWKATSRKHEGRAKENADAATKARTVEQQLEDMRKQLVERDERDLERNGRLAMAQVKAKLAGSGLSHEDMAGLFDLINPKSLLSEGEPDDKAIDKLAASLVKVAGRTSPDPDQGRKGGKPPTDMNVLIRRAAGINI